MRTVLNCCGEMIIASTYQAGRGEGGVLDLKVGVWWRAERTELRRKLRRRRQVGSAISLSAVPWVIHVLKKLNWGYSSSIHHVRTHPPPMAGPMEIRSIFYTGPAL